MNKRREVLEKFVDMITDGQHIADGITMEIDTFLTALDKLEKEKMLEYVGVNDRLVDLLKDILEWDGILQHSKIRIEQAIAKSERR